MSNRLQSLLPINTCRVEISRSLVFIALAASAGCADGAESPADDNTGIAEQTTTATTATATTGPAPGSTSGADSTPDTQDTAETQDTADTQGTSGTSPTTGEGATGDPTDEGSDSGSGSDRCLPGSDNVTAMGSVIASSTFGDNEFPAALGVDGDPATSWFSAGPGPMAGPATFAWTVDEPRCLSTLVFTGNGGHANPDFHEQFGFEAVTVRVFLGEKPVFQTNESLRGTPDPTVTVELGDVFGDRVELELSGHEDPICGGFAELEISGP